MNVEEKKKILENIENCFNIDIPKEEKRKLIINIIISNDDNGKTKSVLKFTNGSTLRSINEVGINELINLDTIYGLIDFILNNSYKIEYIYKLEQGITLEFPVDHKHKKSINNIEYDLIDINFDFTNINTHQNDLIDYFFKNIFLKYYIELNESRIFNEKYSTICDNLKNEVIESLSYDEMMNLAKKLSYHDLCYFILSLSNTRFISLYNEHLKNKTMKEVH